MKPRLEPCDHTEADAHVWTCVVLAAAGLSRFGSLLWTRSLMQDRSDADLMLKARQQREWLEVEDGSCGPDFCLPPWFMPFEWDCGPVGGDITRFV